MSAVDNLSKWVLGSLKKASDTTSHPVGSVDAKTVPATQGSRAAENATDANAQTPGQPAASAPAASETSAAPVNPDTSAGVSGARPSEPVKMTADDPGTAHAAKASFATIEEVKKAGLAVLADLASAKQAAATPIVVEVEKEEPKSEESEESEESKEDKSETCEECKCSMTNGKCANDKCSMGCGAKKSEQEVSCETCTKEKDSTGKCATCPAHKKAEDDKSATESANKKPDADGDGVPDWADKKPGAPDQAKAEDKKVDENTMAEAKAAGAAAADAVINALGLEGDMKSASVQLVEDVVKSAEYDASNVCDYLAGFTKAAAEAAAPMAEPTGADAITPEQLMQLLDEAGVSPEELLVELVQSGQIPPEVAEQILAEAQAVAQTPEAAPAMAPEMAPQAVPAEAVAPAMDAAQQEMSKGAESKKDKADKEIKPVMAPNESETKVVGEKTKQSKSAVAVLKAALNVLESK